MATIVWKGNITFILYVIVGKRLCAGETFARNILFLITAAMCQNFEFVLGPDDQLPDLNTNLSGLIISPKDFWVQLSERSN